MEQFNILVDEMKVRGFSARTIEAYCYHNEKFLDYLRKSPREVTKRDIQSYLVKLYDSKKSSATRHLACSALKFYYEAVLKRRFYLNHPKRENKLPSVLTKEEILRMIDALPNPKHKLLIELLYGSGLRLNEAIQAKIKQFDLANNLMIIKGGKGGKDRYVILSQRFVDNCKEFVSNKNSEYLFQSAQHPTNHIHPRTAQQIMKNALKKAGIKKPAHCHTLRTSYATHLIKNGTDISYVQKLLGHSRVSTTRGYIRLDTADIQKIQSPLD